MKSRLHPFRHVVALLCLFGLALVYQKAAFQVGSSHTSILHDIDTVFITNGAKRVESFSDTLAWWHGPWISHDRPFFRPLSSYFFLAEIRAFGMNGAAAMVYAHTLWHLLTIASAYWFMQMLVGVRLTVFALLIFITSFGRLLGLPFASGATWNWIDGPDLWATAAVCLASGCWLKGLRATDGRRWYVGAFALFVAAVCFKETGYVFPVVAALLAWHERKFREVLPLLAGLAGLTLALLAWRTYSLGGTGHKFGSNRSWPSRMAMDAIGGRAMLLWLMGDFLPLAVILAGMAAWFATRRRWILAGTAAAASWGALALTAALFPKTVTDTAAQLFQWMPWQYAGITGVLLAGYGLLLVRRDRTHLFIQGWLLIACVPLAFGANTEHVYYPPALPWALWLAWTLREVARSISANMPRAVPQLMPSYTGTTPSKAPLAS